MTKIDFAASLPIIFSENNLSILAIENGLYRIAKSDPYVMVGERTEMEKIVSIPSDYVTLDPYDIASESAALDLAHVSGMLRDVFDEAKLDLTIRGRLRKGADFEFEINSVKYPVQGVQIEVDGGYEGKSSVNLIEAKIGSIRTLNLRQLLYPELAWKKIIAGRKKVRTYAFIYEAPYFRFIPFSFEAGRGYFLSTEHEKVYRFSSAPILDLKSVKLSHEPGVAFDTPFPQADSFDKILIMLRKLNEAETGDTKADLLSSMEAYDLSGRQIDYYVNSLRWLKLLAIPLRGAAVELTEVGRMIANLSPREQARQLAKIVFAEETFHTALHAGVEHVPTSLFQEKWGISKSTIPRRKQTMKKWMQWFSAMLEG